MFLYVGFDMLLILILTPERVSISYISKIYPIILFASLTGMILFIMILKESKDKKKKMSYEELKIMEFENILDEYDEKIEELENKIEELSEKNS